MLAFPEGMELFLMFFFFIDVVGAPALGAFLNISAAVAQVKVKFGLRQALLAVVAEFHLLIHMFDVFLI